MDGIDSQLDHSDLQKQLPVSMKIRKTRQSKPKSDLISIKTWNRFLKAQLEVEKSKDQTLGGTFSDPFGLNSRGNPIKCHAEVNLSQDMLVQV